MAASKLNLCMGCMSPLQDGKNCPSCDYDSSTHRNEQVCPPKTLLANRFIVGKALSASSEGTLYIGYDSVSNVKVWIKDFMPRSIVSLNMSDLNVYPARGSETLFKSLLEDFEDVAKTVSSLGAASGVVPLVSLIRQHNTSYAIYKYIDAVTYGEFVCKNDEEPDWGKIKRMFLPLLSNLDNIHKNGIIHRGLSPHSLLVDRNSKIWVFDFLISSARTDLSETGADLVPGYSAPEQYSLSGRQGPWTDVYAAAAILYKSLTKADPPCAQTRLKNDIFSPALKIKKSAPRTVADAIAGAMELDVDLRIQSIDQFLTRLIRLPESSVAPSPRRKSDDHTKIMPILIDKNENFTDPFISERKKRKKNKRPKGGGFKYLIMTMLATGMVLALAVWVLMRELNPTLDPDLFPSNSSSSVQSATATTVPPFVGMSINSILANPEYMERYNISQRYEQNDDYAEGIVFLQSPPAGTPMQNRGTVILTISSGGEMYAVPYLSGFLIETAVAALDADGIQYQIVQSLDNTAIPGIVIGTHPEPGTQIFKNKDTIILYVKYVPTVDPSSDPPPDPSSSQPSAPSGDPWNPSPIDPWNPSSIDPWNPSSIDPWNTSSTSSSPWDEPWDDPWRDWFSQNSSQ